MNKKELIEERLKQLSNKQACWIFCLVGCILMSVSVIGVILGLPLGILSAVRISRINKEMFELKLRMVK